MNSLNLCQFIGNIGRDPETRYSADGSAITNISIACSESWKDKASGEKKEKTEWVRVVFFGKLAEIAGEYLKKGAKVYVAGKMATRKWTDKDGAERYSTEVIADQMLMLSGRQDAEEAPAKPAKPAAKATVADMDDDIPF